MPSRLKRQRLGPGLGSDAVCSLPRLSLSNGEKGTQEEEEEVSQVAQASLELDM